MKYMIKYRKKEILVLILILLFAVLATRFIYYRYKDTVNVDYNSEDLDITFHEESGAEVNLLKATPVTDSVGLSSKAYKFTIKNTTNSSIRYSIKLGENKEKQKNDECSSYQIPRNMIKFSIHKKDEKNKIYTISDLIDGEILSRIIKANQQEEYTMRFWIDNDSNISTSAKLHYHGIIEVLNEGVEIAT